MMRLGVLYERQDRPPAAADAFGAAAADFTRLGDRFGAVRADAIRASNLYAAGAREEALRVLGGADRVASGLPDREEGPPPADRVEAEAMRLAAEARAVLDVHAAFILGCERRYQQAVRRAYAAISGFRVTHQPDDAERSAILAAQITVAAVGPVGARPTLRQLLNGLTPGGEAYRQIGGLLEDAERAIAGSGG